MDEPVRVNTRVSRDLNEWLDKRSFETGVSKSSLINIAVENYRKETETISVLPQLLKKLEEMGITLDEQPDSGSRTE